MCRLAVKKLGKVKGEEKVEVKEREGNIVPRNASNRDVEIETDMQEVCFSCANSLFRKYFRIQAKADA